MCEKMMDAVYVKQFCCLMNPIGLPFEVQVYCCIHQCDCLFVCLCLTSHRQRGHSETAPPFTVPCEGREAR